MMVEQWAWGNFKHLKFVQWETNTYLTNPPSPTSHHHTSLYFREKSKLLECFKEEDERGVESDLQFGYPVAEEGSEI